MGKKKDGEEATRYASTAILNHWCERGLCLWAVSRSTRRT